MKKYTFSIVILFIIISSSCQSKKYISFAGREKYHLSENEELTERSKAVVAEYDKYNNNLEHQVPLEKYVQANNYKLYFGLALYDTPEMMNEIYLDDKTHTIINHKIDSLKKTTSYNFFAKKEDEFNYKIIYKASKRPNLTVVINFTSKDSSLIGNFYENNEEIIKKLKYKK